jgi:hypothetical protein
MGYILNIELPQIPQLEIPAGSQYTKLYEKPLNLQPPIGEIWTVTQISTQLQMGLATNFEKSTARNVTETNYGSEAKAIEATEEFRERTQKATDGTPDTPWEYVKTHNEQTRSGTRVTLVENEETECSLFPCEAMILTQITDSQGIVWSNAMQSTLRMTVPRLGFAYGFGAFTDYADLVNSIDVFSGQRLTLVLSIFVPLGVSSTTLPLEFEESARGHGPSPTLDITYSKRQAIEGG